MIINLTTKRYEMNNNYPNSDWYNEGNLVVDETTEEGKMLATKIKQHAPFMELVIDNGKLIDIIPLERPPAPKEANPDEQRDQRIADLEMAMAAVLGGAM